MQSELVGLFDSLFYAGARFLATCVIGGAAIITARILQSRAKKLHYPNMPRPPLRRRFLGRRV